MEVGDIILTCDRGFIPKAIRFFMRKYAKKLGYDETKFYNHVAVVIENDGDIWVAESAIKGVVAKHTPEYYLRIHKKHLIRTWVKPLLPFEKEMISDKAMHYVRIGTRYDFRNFWDQMRMIGTGAWKGKTGEESKKRLYCSELGAVGMDWVRNSFEGKTWSVNPFDIQVHKELKDKEG